VLTSAVASTPASTAQPSDAQLSEPSVRAAVSWAAQHLRHACRVLLPIQAHEAAADEMLREIDPRDQLTALDGPIVR
jgi:hypothetical protein